MALKIVPGFQKKKPKCEDDAKSHNETMPIIKMDNEKYRSKVYNKIIINYPSDYWLLNLLYYRRLEEH